MKHTSLDNIIMNLKKAGIEFDKGLSEKEINEIEKMFQFQFPPDLKAFYQKEFPISDGFVNWRIALNSKEESSKIRDRLNWPWEGMVFDIENNSFWVKGWGKIPESLDEKIQIARKHFETYPKLVPIYSHRYIPEYPKRIGNPIFSVYQMDIIYYGANLESYFANEFGFNKTGEYELEEYPKIKVDFWSSIAEDENLYN